MGVGLGGASAHFLQSLKHVLSRSLDQRMSKNAYFWNKNVKMATLPPLSNPQPPDQTHALLLLLIIASLSSSFLALNVFYYSQKKQDNYSRCSAFASSAAFALIFHFKLFCFCWRVWCNSICCLRAQCTLAMPLLKQSWKLT